MSFTAQLQSWHDVYLSSAAAGATLAGLLFVGLSLHLRTVVAHADVRALARVTLSSFFTVVLASLYMLVPSPDPSTLGYPLLGIAAGAAVLMVRPTWRGFRNRRTRSLSLWVLAIRFGTTALANLALGVGGAAMLGSNYAAAFQGLLIATLILLMVSVRNTWDLLVTIADQKPG